MSEEVALTKAKIRELLLWAYSYGANSGRESNFNECMEDTINKLTWKKI
jgi:hypothetical protein